jgi:S1-C subfamily serine protease
VRIGRFGLSALLVALVIALVAGGVGGGVGYLIAGTTRDALHNSDVSLAKTGTPANRPPGSVADIIKRVSPAVVSIDLQVAGGEEVGAGIVIDKAGYILTNNHVVAPADGGGGTIGVTFSNQSRASAKIVGRDPQTDLAVLKVQVSTLTVASLGDSGTLAVGDPVIAIGSPLGLMNSASSGIVSALNRPISPPSDNNSDPSAYINAIQTDAAVNPGNSGGALVDASGAVVGVNFALENPATSTGGGQAGSVGLGFSIPMNTARPIAEQLIKTGKVVHASIGLTGIDATDGAARRGAYVKQITPGGPADKAGIKAGDVVTVADSTLVTSFAGLMVIVQGHQPGDVVKVRYYPQNSGNPVDVSVTLGSG